jgi:hypothetical protein
MITGLLAALGWAGAFDRARAWLTGPLGIAIAVTVGAVIVVGSGALGIAWLRKDASRDATMVCNAKHAEQALIVERAKAEAFRRAGMAKDVELARRASDRQQAETNIARLEQEKGELRNEIDDLNSARSVALPDDKWMRQGRRPAAAPARR